MGVCETTQASRNKAQNTKGVTPARDMNRAMRVVKKRTTEDFSEVQLDSITEQPSREGCLG